jgi:hypothetical protein
MKYLKKYNKLFENVESKIDFKELDSILIDFKQMGLEPEVKTGSSIWHIILDFDKLNKDNLQDKPILLSANRGVSLSRLDDRYPELSLYQKGNTNKTLAVEFNSNTAVEYNIEETEEAYEMLKDYLFDNYNLIPNYIYINFHWDYLYFENFDRIKEYKTTYPEDHNGIILGSGDKNIFKAHQLSFGFYEKESL